MPKAKAETDDQDGHIKVRVLAQCAYGKPDDVALLSAAEAKQAVEHGMVDPAPEAVAYAESLAAA